MASQLLIFAGSLVAILALVALAHFLGFSSGGKLVSEEEAADFLRLAAGGFEPREVVLDKDGRGALAIDRQGNCAVLKAHGNHFVARVLTANARFDVENECISIADTPLGRAPVVLRFDNSVAGWVRDLADAR